MSTMQKIFILGRVGNNLDLRVTNSNKKVVEFSVAVNKKTKNEEITTWLNCLAWENDAEFLSKYVKKGDLIHLVGEIRNQKYTNKEGKEITKTYILVQEITLLPNEKKETKEDTRQSHFYRDGMEELEFY